MMKWWGWGDYRLTFPMDEKPDLWPWIKGMLGIQTERNDLPVGRSQITLPPPNRNEAFLKDLETHFQPHQVLFDETERLLHAYGKSFPDLFRVRHGIVTLAPDVVVLPESHEEVETLIRLAHTHTVCVIPFGGGTNIVGGVNPLEHSGRMIASLDMRKMDQLLSLDKHSRTATIQAGALGPKLEADLQAKGYSLGHYPDSFEYSTLGGWLATRSAGMQSDAYGKIEDMVVALKMVTPTGTIVTRPVPASSAGPDLNRLIVGSEGVLGVITEATMRVHRAPAIKDYRGFLFRSFEEGTAAIHACIEQGFSPSLVRLQDSGETQLAFHMKAPKKGMKGWIQKQVKKYLKTHGYAEPCIMIIGFEGDKAALTAIRRGALQVIRKHKGFPLGASVGKTWSKDKFNIPYLRDYVMDFACTADVAETSATWSNVLPLYYHSIRAIKEQFQKDEISGYIGCHISHTYKTGACLYFTFALQQEEGKELEQYYRYKSLLTEAFLQSGGTLSHHHAIGKEHLPWMPQEVSAAGLRALTAIKKELDPKSLLNPGKLLPSLDVGVDASSTINEVEQVPHHSLGKMPDRRDEHLVYNSRNNHLSPLL